MIYGASWMDRWAASSWISERGLSGRQISGGGPSPNSSRMTSARDVMSQHSMGGFRIFETRKSEAQICATRTIQSSPISLLCSTAPDAPGRRVNHSDRAGLRSLGVDGGSMPVGRRTRVVDRSHCNVGCRFEPLSNPVSREVGPPVIGRIELLVQSKVSEV